MRSRTRYSISPQSQQGPDTGAACAAVPACWRALEAVAWVASQAAGAVAANGSSVRPLSACASAAGCHARHRTEHMRACTVAVHRDEAGEVRLSCLQCNTGGEMPSESAPPRPPNAFHSKTALFEHGIWQAIARCGTSRRQRSAPESAARPMTTVCCARTASDVRRATARVDCTASWPRSAARVEQRCGR